MKTKAFQFLAAAVLTLAALLAGQQTAMAKETPATVQVTVSFLGKFNIGNQSSSGIYYIASSLGKSYNSGTVFTLKQSIPNGPYELGDSNYPLSLNVEDGNIILKVSENYTDIQVDDIDFTLTFSSTKFMYVTSASVTNNNGDIVEHCEISGATDGTNNTLTIKIYSGVEFGKVTFTMAMHTPLEYCTISGIDESYLDDGVNHPVPTVTLEGKTLTKDVDYTVSYTTYSSMGTVTVTGIGEYTGTKSQNYGIRQLGLSDFQQISDGNYEIASKDDLDRLATFVNRGNDCKDITFTQTADISYEYKYRWDYQNSYDDTGNGTISVVNGCENNFTSIGGYSKPFKGTFDGGNHTISGIRIFRSGTTDADTNQGLFGYVDGGTVKRVKLKDASIYGSVSFGGIVGNISGNAKVTDCQLQDVCVASGDVTKTNFVVGHTEGDSPSITGTRFLNCCIGTMTKTAGTRYTQQNTRCDVLTVKPRSAAFAGQTHYWTTFYSNAGSFQLPAGAKAFTMKSDKALYLVGDGSIIPADCAVVIMADTESITLTLTDATATPENNNILKGVVANTAKTSLITGTGSQKLYVLGLSGSTFGFFEFSGTTVPAGKAYYLDSWLF